MTAIRIDTFQGMAPKVSNRLLPDTAAELALNCRLQSGELRGVRTPDRIYRFGSTTKTAYRLYKDDGTPVWLGFPVTDVYVAKGPLVNDSFNRHYWTGNTTYPEFNSDTRIENSDPHYKIGVSQPSAAMTVGHTGGTGSPEVRAYTYTFVDTFGHESQPATVTQYTGVDDATQWDLSGMDTTDPDPTNRAPLVSKIIYRTVTGQSSVAYYRVATIPVAQATYTDTSTNAATVLNPILASFTWATPPDDLEGLIAHPGGFLCGFVGRDLYFSVPYRPHAWPAETIVSVEHPIVGLAIYNNMLAVMTKGSPYFFAGTRPENLSPIKSPSAEPCLAASSIASTIAGVLYASQNGLVLFNEAGPSVVTRQILSLEEWSDYSPSSLRGTQYGEQYLAWYDSINAIKVAPSEPLAVFSTLNLIQGVDNAWTDHTSGETFILVSDDVYQWEPSGNSPLTYTWKSKVFDFTRPVNFGAYMIKSRTSTQEITDTQEALLSAYNQARYDADPPDALMPINFVPVGGKRSFTVDVGVSPDGIDEIPQNKYPVGGSPLYDIGFLTSGPEQVELTVWANGRLILERIVQSDVTYRMPAGFKAATWQIQLRGNADIYSFAMAETPRGLQNA
jgi:hypothetical protein